MPSSYTTTVLCRDDAAFPRRLREMKRAPEWLSLRGRVPAHERAVAIVGPRAAEMGHCEAASRFAHALVERGILVVSGGALGIDGAAHRGALDAMMKAMVVEARQSALRPDARGGTVAVLGCGLDVAYPERHGPLFRDICAAGGGLLSPFQDGAPPRTWHFARRNQIMAAMCDMVVVIGAGTHSGALQTAREARKLGRQVAAMPGTPGCEALLAAGAALVRDISDLMRALDGMAVHASARLPADGSPEALVLSVLELAPCKEIDDIVTSTGLSTREAQRALVGLELDGLVISAAGHRYARSRLAGQESARQIEVSGG